MSSRPEHLNPVGLSPTAAERADAILAQIPEAELDALAAALARLLLSSQRNAGNRQRTTPRTSSHARRRVSPPHTRIGGRPWNV